MRQLGEEAVVDVRRLAELDKALRDEGFFDRSADGEFQLSPKAMRQRGQSIFKDVAEQMSVGGGERQTATVVVSVNRPAPHANSGSATPTRGM